MEGKKPNEYQNCLISDGKVKGRAISPGSGMCINWCLFALGRVSWTFLKLSSRTYECPKLFFPVISETLLRLTYMPAILSATCFFILENLIFHYHVHAHTCESVPHFMNMVDLLNLGSLWGPSWCITFYLSTSSLSS